MKASPTKTGRHCSDRESPALSEDPCNTASLNWLSFLPCYPHLHPHPCLLRFHSLLCKKHEPSASGPVFWETQGKAPIMKGEKDMPPPQEMPSFILAPVLPSSTSLLSLQVGKGFCTLGTCRADSLLLCSEGIRPLDRCWSTDLFAHGRFYVFTKSYHQQHYQDSQWHITPGLG